MRGWYPMILRMEEYYVDYRSHFIDLVGARIFWPEIHPQYPKNRQLAARLAGDRGHSRDLEPVAHHLSLLFKNLGKAAR